MSALDNKNCNYISKNKIQITFDGKSLEAYQGDSVASALIRNNIKLLML